MAPIVVYSFCESVYAGPQTRWHIRALTTSGSKLGGGIDSESLCGRIGRGGGWDLQVEITEHHLAHSCHGCVTAYRSSL